MRPTYSPYTVNAAVTWDEGYRTFLGEVCTVRHETSIFANGNPHKKSETERAEVSSFRSTEEVGESRWREGNDAWYKPRYCSPELRLKAENPKRDWLRDSRLETEGIAGVLSENGCAVRRE